jgi:hypothetical protein
VTNHIELLSEVKKIYILAMPSSLKFPKRHMTQFDVYINLPMTNK